MPERIPVAAGELASLELFDGIDPEEVELLAELLSSRVYRAGEEVLRQGELGTTFMIVLDGTAAIHRSISGAVMDLGTAERGAILGELSAITVEPRRAGVIAASPFRVAIGEHRAFEVLLAVPGVAAKLQALVARRLAAIATIVPVDLGHDTALVLRPLLPGDHDEVAAAIRSQPQEWIYSRFFSGGMPSSSIVDYLTNVDYLRHFAWVVALAETLEGIAIGRYIRLREDPSTAEIAFGVRDEWRGSGLGTLLLGALSVAATYAEIEQFHAETLHENRAMQQVLKKAGAHWSFGESGLMETTFAVSDARSVIPESVAVALGAVAREIVTGAGLAPRFPL